MAPTVGHIRLSTQAWDAASGTEMTTERLKICKPPEPYLAPEGLNFLLSQPASNVDIHFPSASPLFKKFELEYPFQQTFAHLRNTAESRRLNTCLAFSLARGCDELDDWKKASEQ